jgi:tetratricopeptide (TPR) repeat protein
MFPMLSITAAAFLVCWNCAAQGMEQSDELYHRIHLVDLERSHGHLAAAESMLADVQKEIERTQPPGLLLATALREHGLLRDDEDRSDEAIPFYERALAMLRANPPVSSAIVGGLLVNLAISHADCGDFEVALPISEEALSMLRAAVEQSSPVLAVSLYAHGITLHGLGRSTEALRDLRESRDMWDRSDNPDNAQVALVDEAIGKCFFDLGFVVKAEASQREALALRTKYLGPDSLSVGSALNNLGVMLGRQQRVSEAQELFERSEAIFEQLGESEERRLTAVLGNLGVLYYNEGRNNAQLYSKAEALYRRKLAIDERMFGLSDVRVSATLEMLGEILYRERAYSEAGRTYGRGLAIQLAAFGPTDPKTQVAAKRYQTLAKKMKVDVAK